MTQVVHQRMLPDTSVGCPLCDGGLEDSSHLFFQCPLAHEAWRVAAVVRLSVTSEEAFWSSLSGSFFRREADFRHIVGNLDPQERGRLQGCHPIRRCHYTHRRGALFFLAPMRRMPLELCTPSTIDLVVLLFINSMEIGGTVWGASLPYFKKKNHSIYAKDINSQRKCYPTRSL